MVLSRYCWQLGLLFLASASLSAQVDDRDRAFLTMGGSFNTGEADPSGSGFFYYNKLDWPVDGTNGTIIYAGAFLEGQLTRTNTFTPSTALGFNAGGLIYLAGLPLEYIDGIPLRDEEIYGNLVFGEFFINHEIGKFSEYKIPLNLRLGYTLSYWDYFPSGDLRPDYIAPSDPFRHGLEFRIQFGGVKPVIRNEEALLARFRYLYGINQNWDSFGPVTRPYEANEQFHLMIGAIGASIPVGEGHYLGAFLTGMTSWGLDRSTAYVLGGFLKRREDSTRIVGFYTSEFIVDQFALLNFSYQFPIIDWQDLAGHLYLDYAYFHEIEPRGGWRDALGVGGGFSIALPYDAALLVAYGYGVNADRAGGSGRHEFVVQTEITFW